MAPERTNTHRVSLDVINQIKNLWPVARHSYKMLRYEENQLDFRRYTMALGFHFVTHEEVMLIERNWEAWKHHFLADPTTAYFELPTSGPGR